VYSISKDYRNILRKKLKRLRKLSRRINLPCLRSKNDNFDIYY